MTNLQILLLLATCLVVATAFLCGQVAQALKQWSRGKPQVQITIRIGDGQPARKRPRTQGPRGTQFLSPEVPSRN